jgi:hypothetical protein
MIAWMVLQLNILDLNPWKKLRFLGCSLAAGIHEPDIEDGEWTNIAKFRHWKRQYVSHSRNSRNSNIGKLLLYYP